MFWNPALQKHANGAAGIAGVVLVAENPTDHHVFLSAFVGERDIQSSSSGVSVNTPRGMIHFDPTAFRDRTGVALTAQGQGAAIAALRLFVPDPASLRRMLRDGGIPATERDRLTIVEPHNAFGATLIFEPLSD